MVYQQQSLQRFVLDKHEQGQRCVKMSGKYVQDGDKNNPSISEQTRRTGGLEQRIPEHDSHSACQCGASLTQATGIHRKPLARSPHLSLVGATKTHSQNFLDTFHTKNDVLLASFIVLLVCYLQQEKKSETNATFFKKVFIKTG